MSCPRRGPAQLQQSREQGRWWCTLQDFGASGWQASAAAELLLPAQGEIVYGAVTDNWPTLEPYFNETGSNCPSNLPRCDTA